MAFKLIWPPSAKYDSLLNFHLCNEMVRAYRTLRKCSKACGIKKRSSLGAFV